MYSTNSLKILLSHYEEYGKNGFVEGSKHLARYRSKNNFVRPSK